MGFNASTTRQNRLKMARVCNDPSILVNEDNISELMGVLALKIQKDK